MPMQYAIYMHLRTKKSKTIQFSKNTNINTTVLFGSIRTFVLHLPNSYYSFFTKIFERNCRKKNLFYANCVRKCSCAHLERDFENYLSILIS